MAALPYIQFFPADYLADTVFLSLSEHGAYHLLILNYWQKGEPLPNDDDKLSRVIRVTLKEWLKVKPAVSSFFDIDQDVWRHKRIDADLARVRGHIEQKSRAGKASALLRDNSNTRTNGNPTPVEHPLNSRTNGNSTNISTNLSTNQLTELSTKTYLSTDLVSVGENGTHAQQKSHFVPEDFQPDESWYSTHRHRNPEANYHVELARFKAHEFKTGKSDWQRAWQSWWLKAKPDTENDTRNSLEKQTDRLLGIDRRYI
jgi:uncharacterized protein YdaU (DUF1376 family)